MMAMFAAGQQEEQNPDQEEQNPVAVESVKLDKSILTLSPGVTGKLTATVMPSNATDKTVTWSSSAPAVATVSNDGTVTAVAEGIATITAWADDKEATCTVTVKNILVEVDSIMLGEDTLTLEPGKTSPLTATVLPENADNKTVTWQSNNEYVATVDENGTVTANNIGNAIITAQAGNKTATCQVTVLLDVEGFEISDNGTLTKYIGTDKDVKIPDGVTGIGSRAFYVCTSLTSVKYGGTKEQWYKIEKDPAIFQNTSVTDITDKDGVPFTVDEDGNITE